MHGSRLLNTIGYFFLVLTSCQLLCLCADKFEGRKEGEPANEIVQLAERRRVRTIVIGSHGRTGLSRLLLGSVA